MNTLEFNTGKLFGKLWDKLTDEQYKDSVDLFRKRAIANNFDLDWIKGKKCLDAGCGSGRYSVALALHGAKSINAIDVSNSGLEEAKRRASSFTNIQFQQASVLSLPFENETFDFVWSAGVIHHTTDFNKSLSELSRVLKSNGKLFILIYGAGGLRWKVIKSLRPIVIDLGQSFVDMAISKSGLPENNRKHFMDDLFVPIQKLTRYNEIKESLEELKFVDIQRWEGNTYDHENDIEGQFNDIKKLEMISRFCVDISKTFEQKHLSNLMINIVKSYLEEFCNITNNKKISKNLTDQLILGEKNIRIITNK